MGKRVHVTHDAIFDESACWDWQTVTPGEGTFVIEFAPTVALPQKPEQTRTTPVTAASPDTPVRAHTPSGGASPASAVRGDTPVHAHNPEPEVYKGKGMGVGTSHLLLEPRRTQPRATMDGRTAVDSRDLLIEGDEGNHGWKVEEETMMKEPNRQTLGENSLEMH